MDTGAPDATSLVLCRTKIGELLGWGPASTWKEQDFEELRGKIFEVTNTRLSITTLKRVCGKVNYEGSFNIATLNAIAQFIGYENWRDFKDQNVKSDTPKCTSNGHTDNKLKRSSLSILIITVLTIALIFSIIIHFSNNHPRETKTVKSSNYIY